MECFSAQGASGNDTVTLADAMRVNTSADPFLYSTFTRDKAWLDDANKIIDRCVIPFICLLGMTGNACNIIVLSRKSFHGRMERLEKSAHIALIALALSDFMFCTLAITHAWVDNSSRDSFSSDKMEFWIVYRTYGHALINTFILCSCWITTAMAACRYLAIRYPFRARRYLGPVSSAVINLGVFLLSVIFNLPRFWMKRVTSINCTNNTHQYFQISGPMETNKTANLFYMWLYFALGIIVPLVVLAYCNVFLIRTLRASNKMHQDMTRSSNVHSSRIVTLILCIIVVFFIVLVSPAELLTFWRPYVVEKANISGFVKYGFAVSVCNTLQAANFALNFIIYCVINAKFRKAVVEICLCHRLRGKKKYGHVSTTSHEGDTHETIA